MQSALGLAPKIDTAVRYLLNNEVNQLVLQHILCICIRDEEGEVEALDRFPT